MLHKKYSISLFVILFLDFFDKILFCQVNSLNPEQEFIYNSNILEIRVTTNHHEYNSLDTFNLCLFLKNNTDDTIAIFMKPHFKTIVGLGEENSKIFIDFGGRFESFDMLLTMNLLPPNYTDTFSYFIPADSLIKRGLKNIIQISLDMGFIDNIDKIFTYASYSNFSPQINNDQITFSGMENYFILSKIELGIFSCIIRN